MYIPKKKTSVMEDIRRKNKLPAKIKQKLTFTMLDLIASYIISDNKNIRTKGYNNINKLINLLDRSLYQDDADLMRLEFIEAALEARLKHKLIKKEHVIDYIKTVTSSNRFDINIQEISNDEVNYINESITNLLDTAEYSYQMQEFVGLSKEFDNATPYHKKELIEVWKNLVSKTNTNIRMNKIEKDDDEILCLSNGFEDYARRAHAELSDESGYLMTGMQGLNALLGKGFENGRTYCFFGLQGEGKSVTLLDMALQIKRYNKNYKTKDPTKIPAVVYLTLENTKRETLQRFFVQSADVENQYTDYSVDKAIDMMINQGGLVVTDDNPIDIVIKQKSPNSVDTSYLYDLYDDLSDQGFEVICFIIDYLKIINSINGFSSSEERLKLGSVVLELKSIASELDIPVITASQFNRDANSKVDEARNSSIKDTLKYLNRANIGESMLILDNLDGSFTIAPEHSEGIKYLGIKLIKARYKPNLVFLEGARQLHHLYTKPDGIKLMEDVGQKKVSHILNFIEEVQLNPQKPGTIVDKNVTIPDNSNRCKETIIPANEDYKSIKNKDDDNNKENDENNKEKKIFLDENGKELPYNPNWRDEPKYKKVKGIGELFNVDSLPPEQQIRQRMNAKQALDNLNNPSIINLPGPSRYSDEYTLIYDPTGSKEERLAYDYNLMYDKNFTEDQFWMLKDHLDRVKRKEISEDDLSFRPFYHVDKNVTKNPFIKITAVERRASLGHSSVHEMLNKVIS